MLSEIGQATLGYMSKLKSKNPKDILCLHSKLLKINLHSDTKRRCKDDFDHSAGNVDYRITTK